MARRRLTEVRTESRTQVRTRVRLPVPRPLPAWPDPAGIRVSARGPVTADDRERVRAAVADVLARHRCAGDRARVRLTAGGPLVVQINLRVGPVPARVQLAGAGDTIAAAAARLERQVRRLSIAWEPWPWPDPERPQPAFPGSGSIARLKTFWLHVGVPCQAVAILNAMDYDVFLFTDADTGEDAVVDRAGPTGLRLTRQRTMRPPALPTVLPMTVNPRRTPVLTAAEAARRVATYELPYLFYTDRGSGRGNLLYHRYDANLGLISPTEA